MDITAAQCRAARALLGWSQDQLAENAKVARATVTYFERNLRVPLRQNAVSIVSTLETAGVAFISEDGDGGGVGARFREIKLEHSPTSRPVNGGDDVGIAVRYVGQRYLAVIPREVIDDIDGAHYPTFEARVEAVQKHLPIYLAALERKLAAAPDQPEGQVVVRSIDLPRDAP
jgi:transcriptional regulator with XRE-family HTH domain